MELLDFLEEKRAFYDNQTIEVPGDEEYSQSQLIHSINCARLSRYVDADMAADDIIGDFPYDNISKYRIRLEARAIDPDTKMIEVEPENGSREARISSMIATKALKKKMREIKLANTFNKITDTWSEYGGVLVKWVPDDGVFVQPWENVITDMSDILGGVIITRHYYTPSQLKKQGWDNVDEVIRTAAVDRKEEDMDKNDSDKNPTITDLIEVWEVHGEVTKALYKEAEAEFNGTDYDEEEDDDVEYITAQIIVAPQGKDEKGKMQGTILQINEEKELPFKYFARNPHSGRGLGQGIVEELGEHQRWHNFYKTEEARALAIGGKVLFVTNDGNVVDTIFDEGIEHGTIMKVGNTGNEFFQQLNTLPSSVPLYQQSTQNWSDSGDKLTNSFATALGSQEHANVPFKAQYLQDLNSNSQFKQYYEEMAEELIKPIIEDWVLPEALEEAASDDEIYETFSKGELRLIDDVIIAKELPKRIAKIILEEDRPVPPEEAEAMKIGMQAELDRMGTRRNLKKIKDFIKDAAGKVVIHTSNEQRDKQTLFESYSNALQLFGEQDPARFALRDRILDQMGVTQEELALYAEEAMAVAQSATPQNAKPEQQGVAEQDLKAELIS